MMKQRLLTIAVLLSLIPLNVHAWTDEENDRIRRGQDHYIVNDEDCVPGAGSGTPGVPGKDNVETVWRALMAKAWPADGGQAAAPIASYQVAGIMGNMQSESGFDPTQIELKYGGGNSNNPGDADPGGYGLAQWTPGSKLIPLLHGKTPPDIFNEVDALWEQLTVRGASSSELGAGNALRTASDLPSATLAFETKYERHGGGPQPIRITQAKAILDRATAEGWPMSGGGGGGAADGGSGCTGGGASGGCTGGDILTVPAGGQGVNTCYFNQSRVTGGENYNWGKCGCLPTSSLMIRATMENNPGLDPGEVLKGIRAHGGVLADDNCSGVISGALDYFRSINYTVEEILPRKGHTTEATLNKVKEALGQGKLVLTHTSNYVDSANTSGTIGHFLVVHAVDGQGNFYVANPGANADKGKAVPTSRVLTWLDGFWAIKK